MAICSRAICFSFRGKRADHLKVLYYDGTGLCLFAKRTGFTLNPFPFGRHHFGEVACWSAAARSTRRGSIGYIV